VKDILIHLRLHFQLLLSPVFLWGWLVAGGEGLTVSVALAFIAFHVFLYAGATAFNSYYDRDEGPVGGLERPPPVTAALLPVSLAMKAIGLLVAALVNVTFALIYALFAVLSLAYSQPLVRLKARPWSSLLTVAFGQGVLAFLGAWAAARGSIAAAWSLEGVLGSLAAALMILGLYPLTQLYQVDEDLARGDRTVAVAWGANRCFALSLACLLTGGLAMLVVVGNRFGALDAVVVAAGLVAQMAAVAWWARHFHPAHIVGNYRHVMRLNSLSGALLGGYLVVRLIAR
jgi:4-hydroxybenzoate polyprenyltransferase